MSFSKKGSKIVLTTKVIILIIFIATTAFAELRIDSVYPTLGLLGQDLEVTLKGGGFDANTRVSMSLDVGNQKAIIDSVDTPDNSYDIDIVGKMAYVADFFSGLQVIDISNPAKPKIIGSVDKLSEGGYALSVKAVGSYAYVIEDIQYGDEFHGLWVVDISNPTTPHIISTVHTPGAPRGLDVMGNYVFIADGSSGLQIIDISAPLSPQIIGSVETTGFVENVAVSGDKAYVVSALALYIIDISDPKNPLILLSLDTSGYSYYNQSVTLADNKAYIAGSYTGLQVIDISNPTDPMVMGSVDTPGYAMDATIVEDKAYVADGSSGLQIIDISNPSKPEIVGLINTLGMARGVTVVGSNAYVVNEIGLKIMDISNPSISEIIGRVDTGSYAYDVEVVGPTSYVVIEHYGLWAIDISNPESPQTLSRVNTSGHSFGLAIVDNIAFVAGGNNGLQLVDISDPSKLVIISSVDTPDNDYGGAFDVAVVGDKAYVADCYPHDLYVIDISNLASPQITGSVYTGNPRSCGRVAASGDLVYLANGLLKIIDVSNPESPQVIGEIGPPGWAQDVAVINDTAYVADGDSGLKVIDVKNPSSPQIIGSVDTPGDAKSVRIIGNTVYVADGTSGIQVIDISNKEKPQIIGSVDTIDTAISVDVAKDLAYVADNQSGLVIVPLPTEIEPVTITSEVIISVTLPSPSISSHYTLRVFNETESDELPGAVSFTSDLQILNSKAIIVAGGGPNAPGEIWEETKQSANKAYDILIYEGYDHGSIWYLSGETGNPYVDGPSLHYALDDAINNWAKDASELVIFFVDHGIRDYFIIYADNDYSQQLYVNDLDDWLDNLQQNMVGPITFIYDACHSGTFASKLNPPTGKDRVVISGASDEPAYFRGEDNFSFQFWDQIFLNNGNLGSAFSGAAEIMLGYQTALINANGNSLTNEAEDFTTANGIIIRRGQPIYLKPAPTIGHVIGDQSLNGSTSATLWVSGVLEAESVWVKIIPPDINSDIDGVPITDLPTIELQDTDHDGTYDGTYHGFTAEGTYTIITNAQTSQEIYSYVQGAMVTQIIPSSPVYTSVTQINGAHNIKADDYEEDDTYPQANVITLNDLDVQPHNFHDLGDVDWVKFYGLSGKKYIFKAGSVSVICNVVIELFDSDGITRLKGPWNEVGNGEEEIMEWTCTRDDVYYVKLSNANATFGENCKYDLKLYRPIAPLVGFVTGIVKNAITRQALGNVQIKTSFDQSTLSLSNGSYMLVHPPGSFTVTAQLAGYNIESYSDVQVNEGAITTRDIVLVPGSIDTDNDGILDAVEYASSCLDANDADTDNDGLVDGQEDKNCNGIFDPGETHPCDQDTDGDQMPDGWEVQYSLNPLVDDASEDADGDGYSNLQEYIERSDPTDQFSLPQIRSLPWIPLLLLDNE